MSLLWVFVVGDAVFVGGGGVVIAAGSECTVIVVTRETVQFVDIFNHCSSLRHLRTNSRPDRADTSVAATWSGVLA